jgi:hypothetical protein
MFPFMFLATISVLKTHGHTQKKSTIIFFQAERLAKITGLIISMSFSELNSAFLFTR